VNGRRPLDEELLLVWEGLRSHVRGILAGYHIPAQDAEDVVQTALLAMIAKWPEVDDPRAWLAGTLRRCCARYWRERGRHESRFRDLNGLGFDPAAETDHARRDLLIDLDSALAQLPAGPRKLLVLRFRLGLESEEVARAMGLASSSIRQMVGRALARLSAAVYETPPAGHSRGVRTPGAGRRRWTEMPVPVGTGQEHRSRS
jgi:RNA polymerase sigma factor (sigma-70 family)